MKASVVIRSRDEAPRLRLTLASLAGQPAEIVVVDDGSIDGTRDMLGRAHVPITIVRHAEPLGRAAAANAGAAAAQGGLLIFLDGDTLAGPGMVAAHLAAHRARAGIVGRGETWHLRCTRTLADPETGATWPDAPPLADGEGGRVRVTLAQICEDFDAIARRASPGIYPGAAPRRLYDHELRALRERPGSPTLWAAASGSNLSVRAADFRAAGGFDPALDINEHRELALRLMLAGARMTAVEGARTYHLTHRSGWRDPLTEPGWREAFRRAHPDAPLDRLTAWWQSLAQGGAVADWIDDAA